MNLPVGAQLTLKKKHPCGSDKFIVLRVGSDIKIKCIGCLHEMTVPRIKLEKSIKNILEKQN